MIVQMYIERAHLHVLLLPYFQCYYYINSNHSMYHKVDIHVRQSVKDRTALSMVINGVAIYKLCKQKKPELQHVHIAQCDII